MTNDIVLIITLSLIIIFSPFLAKVLKLLTTPVEIILGTIAGYIGLLHHSHLFELVAEVGFLYLMFLAGTEVDIKKVLNTPSSRMKNILLYIGLLYLLSIATSLYLDLGNVIMVLLPLISVGLVATLTKEYGKTQWLELSMTAGGIGEVVSIAVLTLSAAILQFGVGFELAKSIAALLFFIVFIVLLFKALRLFFWWYPEISTVLMPYEDNKEQDVRLSMGILFILVALMLYLELELAFGAFIAGMFIPTFFEHKEDLPHKLGSYGFGFLVPIFFIYIGASLDVNKIGNEGLIITALIITFAMIFIRMVSSVVFIRELGVKNSILLGLSHSMPLTLLIAIAALAFEYKSIDEHHYYAFILASLFEVIIVLTAIKLVNMIKSDPIKA